MRAVPLVGLTPAAAILAVGMPLGVLTGTVLWHRLADAFGIGAGALVGTGIVVLVPARGASAGTASACSSAPSEVR